ncbi:MAG: N-acetylmuramoyl-L-alanine amidase [Pseudomonadota bacterium]
MMTMLRLLGLFLLLAPSMAGAGAVVNGVRASTEANHTRVVFDLSGPARYNLFTLRQPDRVVIDIVDGKLGALADRLPKDIGVVRTIRAAERGQEGLRIVLDLDHAIRARSFLAGPARGSAERLVIDLGERAAMPTVKRLTRSSRDIVVVLDPGHGGHDPGAVGKQRTYEKDVVLAIARRLRKLIDAEPGMRALMVRDRDVYIDHWARMEIARSANADLFVSIHADAVEDRRARGSSVYALSLEGASSEAARRLAADQNASLIGGVELTDKEPDLARVLMDLSQTATLNSSIEIGQLVLNQMGGVNRLHRRTVQQAGFIVLKSPDVPSILVETAYISNPQEEQNLRSAAHQEKLAQAIFSGIREHFVENPPVDSLFAQLDHNQVLARTHTISPGDTLSEIADRYRVSLARLRQENALTSDRIRVGQVLRIPGG